MKYTQIVIIILVLFISYKLCGILPEAEGGTRKYFCKNPILYEAIFLMILAFMYFKKK